MLLFGVVWAQQKYRGLPVLSLFQPTCLSVQKCVISIGFVYRECFKKDENQIRMKRRIWERERDRKKENWRKKRKITVALSSALFLVLSLWKCYMSYLCLTVLELKWSSLRGASWHREMLICRSNKEEGKPKREMNNS